MGSRRDLTIVRNLANFPQSLDRGARCGPSAHVLVARKMLQYLNILGNRRAREALLCGNLRQRGRQRAERAKVERTVAPLQHLHGIEAVALQRLHQIGLERRAAAGRAESAVARRTPRPAGDLAKLGRVELAELIAVE